MGASVNFSMIGRNSEALETTLCYYKINRNFGKHAGKPENRQASIFYSMGKRAVNRNMAMRLG